MSKYVKGEKTMIIKADGVPIFDGLENVVYPFYDSYAWFIRVFRMMIRILGIRSISRCLYGRWKKNLNDCNLVILFDSGILDLENIIEYIRRKNPKARIVFWYWNPVKPNDYVLTNNLIDEIWTYDRFDAKKYNLKYNPQFYRPILKTVESKKNIDMIFVGKDKGRKDVLLQLEKDARQQGLICDFTVIEKEKGKMRYEEYLKRLMGAKCVVDLVPNQDCGLTLRPLEALFYKKKLVTDYKDIVNYDFYNKENIFLLGKDDMNRLAEFMDSPYKEIDSKIVNFYSYENWLKRIERKEDVNYE